MGLLIDGVWHDRWYDTGKTGGRFERESSRFRNWVTPGGTPGPSGDGGFAAEAGRYHLYAAAACPWSHRVLILRRLKGLERQIGLTLVNPLMAGDGWTFAPGRRVDPDPLLGARYLHQIYTAADPHYTGRVTVPVLWDKKQHTIVSNESADLLVMLNSAFDHLGAAAVDFDPPELRERCSEVDDWIYRDLNNGVYRAGFATSQAAYEEAVLDVFGALDRVERLLGGQRYLTGSKVTLSDWRLFVTLYRFDAVYYSHFKCNLRRLIDYPALWSYTRALYQWPGVAATCDLISCKLHYHQSHRALNPAGIVPLGPALDFTAPHDRERLPAAD